MATVNEPEPITTGEMAGMLRRVVNSRLPDVADEPAGSSFEMVAPATGQRFRVTVEEIGPFFGQPDGHAEIRLAAWMDGTPTGR
jgi:hypothetical protein